MATKRHLRSQDWFDDREHADLMALYERFMNYGLTPTELMSGKPIIGIAQSGSDLTPCNRIHVELATRVKDGVRDAGGIPLEFPMHPIFENCRRQPAGRYLGERFHRAEGVPAVLCELIDAGNLHADTLTVTSRTLHERDR
jgi:dihydroxyacid dehydratase/phosphogluconate dehydratase